ncbi:DinB family protein [soil metagenome]
MKETMHITKLLDDLYSGDPWIDVSVKGTLKNISASQAVKRMSAKTNSIWEIVNHLINWRLAVLQRVQGVIFPSPDNNFFEPVADTSEKAWVETLQQFDTTQQKWKELLANFNDDYFSKTYSVNNQSYYELIHGIIQHDAYHLGQIVLLSKLD